MEALCRQVKESYAVAFWVGSVVLNNDFRVSPSVVVQFESSVTVSLSGAGREKVESWQVFVCLFVSSGYMEGRLCRGIEDNCE